MSRPSGSSAKEMSITLRLESGPDGSWWAKEMLVKVMDKFLFFKKPA